MPLNDRLISYAYLIRLDKPIGTLLLLWPTLWALWLASSGVPDLKILLIFVVGTFLMRSAGCAMNDYADRNFDLHVQRTQGRPVTSGKISGKEAVLIAALLALTAFFLIQPLNDYTKTLSVFALAVAFIYPFTKRFFAIPQAILGIAFGFGIPMGFAAILNSIPAVAWLLLIANIFWAIAYDTEYAMVDRDDDIRLGLKTSAITFGKYDIFCVALCYLSALLLLGGVGYLLSYGWPYALGLLAGAGLAALHIFWIRQRTREGCFRAFLHNTWIGFAVFCGIFAQTIIFS
jgi:4-hydroxybenzoate polyprenyltransferase